MSGGLHAVWSEDEITYLLNNYKSRSITELTLDLNRSYQAVAQKLYKYRLSSSGRILREILVNPKVQAVVRFTHLPVFHPVMVGIYPNRDFYGKNAQIWRKRRKIILKMHDYCCVYCGDDAHTVDHIIPVDRGGLDAKENLVAACSSCNSAFGNKVKHIEWITPHRSEQDLC